jgi:hypothetical protein
MSKRSEIAIQRERHIQNIRRVLETDEFKDSTENIILANLMTLKNVPGGGLRRDEVLKLVNYWKTVNGK